MILLYYDRLTWICILLLNDFMDCPVCRVPLIVVERSKIEVDFCIGCKGLWFDEGEISLLAESFKLTSTFPDIMSLPKVKTRELVKNCCRCGKKMDKVQLGGHTRIFVDRCPGGHGLWFDSGELGQTMDQYTKAQNVDDGILTFLGEVFTSG